MSVQLGKRNIIEQAPDQLAAQPLDESQQVATDGVEPESDVDAAGDDEEMNVTQNGTEGNMSSQMNEDGDQGGADEAKNDASASQSKEVDPVTIQARARLRSRATLKKRMQTPEDLESEEDDGIQRKRPSTESEEEGEDELDSDAELSRSAAKRAKGEPGVGTKKIKTVHDLPVYAQHAYVASTYGVPKLPIPMVLLPGLRSRKPPPIPIPELTKRSRGRHVAAADDDGRKYHCTVAGCDKRFARGEHLKRHIRSIHTHEKPHQCPYPGCLRGFSRTDNMMQHMRTHDDWPDDEAAAQLLADVEKKTGKKTANAGAPSEKDFGPLGPIMPFPWQMHPVAFLKWAQQQGNPFVPFVPPHPLPTDPSSKDILAASMEINAELVMQDPAAVVAATAQGLVQEHAAPPSGGTAEQQTTSPPLQSPGDSSTIAPDLTMMPTPASQDAPATKRKNSKSKPPKGTLKVAATPTPAPAAMESLETDADVSMDFSMSNMMSPLMGGMPPWPMPPGMQFPFMMPPHMPPLPSPPAPPLPSHMPHMPPQMPPGMPFPPPAIAIPIPAGAPLPHPTQLPPNAQLIPDSKGGHTVIIPPPPSPWGMPFLPGMMPGMPMFPGAPAPPLDLGASNVEKSGANLG